MNSNVFVAHADSDIIIAMRRGYEDAYFGKPFDAAYDTMSEKEQRNYELGRQMAWTIIGARGKRALWKADERSGALFRRALGDVRGSATVRELNEFTSRDAR